MKHKRKLFTALADIIIVNFALLVAFSIRHIDEILTDIPYLLNVYLLPLIVAVPILSISVLVIFHIFGVYRTIWRFARANDVFILSVATTIAFMLFMGLHIAVIEIASNMPLFAMTERLKLTVYFLSGALSLVMVLGMRLAIRMIAANKKFNQKLKLNPPDHLIKIMVIGGGSAGNMLLHDLQTNSAFTDRRAVCIIDDNPTKLGMNVYGVRVVGNRDTIIENAQKYEINQIIFAIPNSSPSDRAQILEICSKTGCDVRTLPSVDQMLDGKKIGMEHVRKVNVEDLLGREPINVDIDSIAEYVKGKVVLVTGGGGSIGSELCRQVANHNPKQLIIFDVYENNAYNILNELKSTYPELNVTALIGTIRDAGRLDELFRTYKPQIVYHAAAHKHVPLMEDSPKEAIKNNVFGTLNLVKTADKYGVKRFVMISTDKAVNPTNIMGASKRICEMIVQTQNKNSKTEFITVRFGNVLGSNGSVIPIFEKQISEGGPVTVTDKRIVRYFMTIPEAVSLVLQAGAFGKGGEIFVLNMGKPMKIVELAENLIRLSGYEPYKDIDIKFIGLRPGEKLYEELLMAEEGLKNTSNKRIFIGKPINIDENQLEMGLSILQNALDNDTDIREAVKQVVPTYEPKD